MSRLALQNNRQTQQLAYLGEGPRDVAQAELRQPTNAATLAPLSDEHYAISAAELDRARNNHSGNWVLDNHAAFCEKHRTIVEHQGPEDYDGEADQAECPLGFCMQQVCREDAANFERLMSQAKDALRIMRAVRRKEGFKPAHLLLLLAESFLGSDGLLDEIILEMHLCIRLSFSPLDATVVALQPGFSPGIARLAVLDGVPVFYTLHSLVHKLVRSYNGKDVYFKYATYSALSLSEFQLTGHTSVGAGAVVAGASSSSDSGGDDDAMQVGLRLLKRAVGKGRQRGRGPGSGRRGRGGRGTGNGRGRGGRKRRNADHEGMAADSAPAVSSEHNPSGDKATGVAGETHNDVMAAWGEALNEHFGPLPTPSSAAPPPTRPEPAAGASSSKAAAKEISIQSTTHPWRDKDGHCWIYNHETAKPFFLGRCLSNYVWLCEQISTVLNE